MLLEVSASVSLPPHPNVLRLLDVAATQTDIRLVYPLYDMTLLSWYRAAYKEVGGLRAEEYQFMLWQLLLGVDHLHAHEVLHGDIKPSNILVRCPPLLDRAPVDRDLAGQGAFLDDASWGQDTGWGGGEKHGRKHRHMFWLSFRCCACTRAFTKHLPFARTMPWTLWRPGCSGCRLPSRCAWATLAALCPRTRSRGLSLPWKS